MPIQIGAKGWSYGGNQFPAHAYVDWLSVDVEALAVQGGDAMQVPPMRSIELMASVVPRQLTGGTVGVETALLEVPLAQGLLLPFAAYLEIRCAWWYSLNANSKTFRVALGTNLATATNLYTRTRNSATQGQDSGHIILQRDTTALARIRRFGDTGLTYFGQPGVNNAATPMSSLAVDPAAAGLKLYFAARLDTANTDQVTLALAHVRLGFGLAI